MQPILPATRGVMSHRRQETGGILQPPQGWNFGTLPLDVILALEEGGAQIF